MTDGDRAEENALIQDHGHRLFGRYMEILMEGGPEVFLLTAKNFAPAGKAHGMFSVYVQKKHVFFNVLHSIFSFIVFLILIIMLCLIGNHAGIDDAHGVQDRLGRANL